MYSTADAPTLSCSHTLLTISGSAVALILFRGSPFTKMMCFVDSLLSFVLLAQTFSEFRQIDHCSARSRIKHFIYVSIFNRAPECVTLANLSPTKGYPNLFHHILVDGCLFNDHVFGFGAY